MRNRIGNSRLINGFKNRIFIFIKKYFENLIQDKFQNEISNINDGHQEQKFQNYLNQQNRAIRQIFSHRIVDIIANIL